MTAPNKPVGPGLIVFVTVGCIFLAIFLFAVLHN